MNPDHEIRRQRNQDRGGTRGGWGRWTGEVAGYVALLLLVFCFGRE